jgi:hypothetical protein
MPMADRIVAASRPRERRPLIFLAIVLALAIPIWVLSRFVGVIGALKVPVTDLMLAFTPLTAGCFLVASDEGGEGLIRYLARAFAFRSLARSGWFAAALLLAPLIYLVTYAGLHLAGYGGEAKATYLQLPVLAVVMFALAIGEEAGWTGYLLDPLQARFGALGASLIIAIPWWLGHIPSILEIGGGVGDLAIWFPGAIALRVLMTWLYNNSGRSLAAVVLFHTLLNVGRSISYPTIGSHYDPVYQATGYGVAFVLALLAVMVWGPKRLTKAAG